MVAFAVIVCAKLGQRAQQGTFAKKDQLGQAFFLGTANPTFRERIEIRTLGGKHNGFHSARRQHRPK